MSCIVCGIALQGRERKRCARHRKFTYYKTCQCGCNTKFWTSEKSQQFLNRQHMGKVMKRRQLGRKNTNYKHGLTCKPRDRKLERKLYSTETLRCQNPECKKEYKCPKSEKDRRKYCSDECKAKVLLREGKKGFQKKEGFLS